MRKTGKNGDLPQFVDALQARGRYSFSRDEARSALGISETALRSACRRLAAKGRIIAPRRGFYVIVPLEHRSAGAPPPSWFIDDLMRFHRRSYYVGLLSAAALHGAAHQQPQEFQVVTAEPIRPAKAGRARIRFIVKKRIENTPSDQVKTETGFMRVSTPEATALDLVRYVKTAGGLSRVATVLSELGEKISPKLLVKAARGEREISIAQRLGFLLDRVGKPECAGSLAAWVKKQDPRPALLRPGKKAANALLDRRWRVVVNDLVEVDL